MKKYLPHILILFYLSEFATKLLQKFRFDFINISALVKGVFMIIVMFFFIRTSNSYQRKIVYFITFIVIIFFAGQLSFSNGNLNIHLLFENSIFLGRYLLVFFLVLLFGNIYGYYLPKSVFKVFEIIIILNCIFILIGFIFEIEIFETYRGERFGYSGVFIVPSMSTFFYALAFTYSIVKWIRNRKSYLLLLVVLISSFLVGTKALWLFMCLTFFNISLHFGLWKKKIFVAGIAFVSLILIIKNQVILWILEKNLVLNKLYNEDGLMIMLTSYRSSKFKDTFNEVLGEKWGILNYVVGGTNFAQYRFEFDFLDVILFFGLLGAAIYFYYYFTRVIILSKYELTGRNQILILLFIALLSGNFFNNGAVPMYLLIVLNFIQEKIWKTQST